MFSSNKLRRFDRPKIVRRFSVLPLNLIWSLILRTSKDKIVPKGGLKTQNDPFPWKKCTFLEESLLQDFFVWKLSATKAFIGLSIGAKMMFGDINVDANIWLKLTNRLSKRPFWINFRRKIVRKQFNYHC